MLDTKVRSKIEVLFDKGASFFIKKSFTPSHVTVMALIAGLLASAIYYFFSPFFAVLVLWFSGYLDAVDGNMARKTNKSSKFGTLMDIVFDRIVEIGIIISVALKNPQTHLWLIFLCCSIIISMTIFLTTGALAENNSKKSFHYQAGLMERTEGFILFSFMMVLEKFAGEIAALYAALVAFTALQRFIEAKRML